MDSVVASLTYSAVHFASGMVIGSFTDSLFAMASRQLRPYVVEIETEDGKEKILNDSIDLALAALECTAEMMVIGGFAAFITHLWSGTDDMTVGIPFIIALGVSTPHFTQKARIVVVSFRHALGLLQKIFVPPNPRLESTRTPSKNSRITAPVGTRKGSEP